MKSRVENIIIVLSCLPKPTYKGQVMVVPIEKDAWEDDPETSVGSLTVVAEPYAIGGGTIFYEWVITLKNE